MFIASMPHQSLPHRNTFQQRRSIHGSFARCAMVISVMRTPLASVCTHVSDNWSFVRVRACVSFLQYFFFRRAARLACRLALWSFVCDDTDLRQILTCVCSLQVVHCQTFCARSIARLSELRPRFEGQSADDAQVSWQHSWH